MMLSYWAAYDTYHHCDVCKNYRESMGPSSSLTCTFTLQCGEKLHFIIPHRYLPSFTFTKDKQLCSLRLPVVLTGGSGEVVKPLKTESGSAEESGAVKSPIMMPSTGRHEYGEKNEEICEEYMYSQKHTLKKSIVLRCFSCSRHNQMLQEIAGPSG